MQEQIGLVNDVMHTRMDIETNMRQHMEGVLKRGIKKLHDQQLPTLVKASTPKVETQVRFEQPGHVDLHGKPGGDEFHGIHGNGMPTMQGCYGKMWA